MLRSTALAPIALALVGLAACGSDPAPAATPDATPADVPVASDAAPDAVEPDAAPTPDVAPTPDAAPDVPEPPIMSSSCDLLAAGTVTDFMVDGAPRRRACGPGSTWSARPGARGPSSSRSPPRRRRPPRSGRGAQGTTGPRPGISLIALRSEMAPPQLPQRIAW